MIKVRRATRAALLARGKKGESYDDIIRSLLEWIPEYEARR